MRCARCAGRWPSGVSLPPHDSDPGLAHPEAAGWVLGVLDPDDAERFGEHLPSCPDCRAAVAEPFHVCPGKPALNRSECLVGQVHPAGELLHVAGAQAVGVEHNGERVAPVGSVVKTST
jgi:hypothetical protein